MRVALYTNSVSPHQLPLAKEIVKAIGVDNYSYIYTEEQTEERLKLGWSGKGDGADLKIEKVNEQNKELLEEVEVLIVGGIRPIELMEKRAKRGLVTLYQTERWFKPIHGFPGWIRMLAPSYRRMAKRFVRLFNNYDCCKYLAIGPWAKKDMVRIGVKEDRIVDWGYFVAPSVQQSEKLEVRGKSGGVLRVLWVGRMLKLKRVDTIISAVREIVKASLRGRSGNAKTTSSCASPLASSSLHSKDLCNSIAPVELTLVGDGPERKRLEKMAKGLPVKFLPSQPIEKIREIMREHDVYVFSSNGMDGWGAVVNEAMEEGMKVLGTYETGASAAMLPETNLFHCGDYKTLAKKLLDEIKFVPIGQWSVEEGAKRLLNMI